MVAEQHTLNNPSGKPGCWRSSMQSMLHFSGELSCRGHAGGAWEPDSAISVCSFGMDTSHTCCPAVWAGHCVGREGSLLYWQLKVSLCSDLKVVCRRKAPGHDHAACSWGALDSANLSAWLGHWGRREVNDVICATSLAGPITFHQTFWRCCQQVSSQCLDPPRGLQHAGDQSEGV